MDISNRVRRSNHSYQIVGQNLRLFPKPTVEQLGKKLWLSVGTAMDPLKPSYQDDSIGGVSGPHNIPYGNISYSKIVYNAKAPKKPQTKYGKKMGIRENS